MRVLIAEDDRTSRMLLQVALGKWGYEVEIVERGDEAWQALERDDRPSIAILDWMMPGLDGKQVCERVSDLDLENPPYIILLTGLTGKENIVAGLEAGADDYVTKPFDDSELRARLRVAERMVELRSSLAQRVTELQEALSHIKTLQGILPICMHCHKIRTDEQAWQRLESYIEAHSGAQFSHGLCPECLEKYYPMPDARASAS